MNELSKVKAQINKELIETGIVQEHRSMYCSTAKGKEAIIRQLGSELHLDSDYSTV